MKKLDISPITDAAEMPIKSGTLQFLQDAYAEVLDSIMKMIANSVSGGYSPTIAYCLWGCQNSTPDITISANIAAGAIYLGGELYQVDAAVFSVIPGQAAILVEQTSQYAGNGTNADPVQFTDTSLHNVHNIRKIQIISAASGSGLSDYTAVRFLNFTIPPQLNLTAVDPDGTTPNAAQILGTYPNMRVLVPKNNNLLQMVAFGYKYVGDIPAPGVTVTVTFSAPLTGVATYMVLLFPMSEGGSVNIDTAVSYAVIRSSMNNSGFQVRCQEWASGVQSASFNYVVYKLT